MHVVIPPENDDCPTQSQQPGMYYPPGPVPDPSAPIYPPNNMNQMNEPPSYDQATQPDYQPSPMPNVADPTSTGNPVQIHQPAAPTYTTVQAVAVLRSVTVAKLEKTSVQTHCLSCSNEIHTRVHDELSDDGFCLAIICCFCGSCLLGLCVLCMDGFKAYHHVCPACNAVIGIYKPEMSCGMVCIFVILSILVIVLQIYVVMCYFIGIGYRY